MPRAYLSGSTFAEPGCGNRSSGTNLGPALNSVTNYQTNQGNSSSERSLLPWAPLGEYGESAPRAGALIAGGPYTVRRDIILCCMIIV